MSVRPVAAGLLALMGLAVACSAGAGDEEAASTSTTTSTTSLSAAAPPTTSTASPTSAEFVRTPGPPTLVLVDDEQLVAVDLRDLSRVVLADGAAVAAELGVGDASGFGSTDLAADASKVVFEFGWSDTDGRRLGGALFEVASDGSAAPTLLGREVGAGYSEPTYSPDGQHLAVGIGTRLVIVDTTGAPTGPGIELFDQPDQLRWSPDGTRLTWIGSQGRSTCCGRASVEVDPATGRATSELSWDPVEGTPYFGPSGELSAMPDFWAEIDFDATGRFAVIRDGDGSQQFAWVDTTDPDLTLHRFGLDVSLPEVTPIAW